jgi:hypothetical protein
VASEHKPYLAAVLDAIDASGPLPIPATEARKSLELCVAIYTAAIMGQAVELPLSHDARFYDGISTDDYQPGQREAPVHEAHR